MIIKKTGASLAIVFSMMAFNASAQELCSDIVDDMAGNPAKSKIGLANELRCEQDLGRHPDDSAIWLFQGGKGKKNEAGDGCDIHQKLARLIYEKPIVKDSKGKGGNKPTVKEDGSRGAARALADGQLEYAVELLEEFQFAISVATLNPEYKYGDSKVASDQYSNDAGEFAKRIIDEDGNRCN